MPQQRAKTAPTLRVRLRELLASTNPEGEQADVGGLAFALSLYALCHAWMTFAREQPGSMWPFVSSSLQYALVFGLYLSVDDRIQHGARRLFWAGFVTLLAAVVLLDGLLLRMTSLPLREILPMLFASQHVVEGMREIGLKPVRLLLLLIILCVAAGAGAVLRMLLGRLLSGRARPRTGTFFSVGWAVVLIGWYAEQNHARDEDEYLYRGVRIPVYAQLHSTSSRSIEPRRPAGRDMCCTSC